MQQTLTLLLLFLTTVVKSQALDSNVDETTDAVTSKQYSNNYTNITVPSHHSFFEEYLGKNDTIYATHKTRRFKQKIVKLNDNSATDTTKIENRDNVEGEMRGKKDSDGKTDGFWYPKYCKSKRCKIIVGIATYLYDMMDSINSFISKLIQTTRYIVDDTKKYKRMGDCGSDTIWVTNRDGDEWQVAISIFNGGKNCDTAASEKEIKRALECAVSDKEFQNKKSFCVLMDDGHSWYAKVRFLRNNYANGGTVRNVQCRSDKKNKKYAYDKNCIEDHTRNEL
ncbi:hypothetical protein MOSE0_J09802 [Monosporozyma servazzii]